MPFTSCTARLTVYVLVATTFFGSAAGTVVFGMYVVSIVLVVVVGLMLRSTLIRSMGSTRWSSTCRPTTDLTRPSCSASPGCALKGFLRTAGGIIVATVAAVWLLSSIPVTGTGSFADTPVSDSAYAAVSRTIALSSRRPGSATGRSPAASSPGFVAKEAVISSWAQTFALEEPSAADEPGTLGPALNGSSLPRRTGRLTQQPWLS